ncbi:hypothetical protein D918_08225 [Trichuris suis]|nr:hypothetical protein D918_08225 [Trichuris suis]
MCTAGFQSIYIAIDGNVNLSRGGPAKRFVFKTCPFEVRFPDKEHVVIVTGASAGIGTATAADLCARGGKVIWAARDTAKAQRKLNDLAWTAHHGKRGYIIKLDLASKKKIDQFVDEFKKRRLFYQFAERIADL